MRTSVFRFGSPGGLARARPEDFTNGASLYLGSWKYGAAEAFGPNVADFDYAFDCTALRGRPWYDPTNAVSVTQGFPVFLSTWLKRGEDPRDVRLEMDELLGPIWEVLAAGKKVLIYCEHGRHRSPYVAPRLYWCM